VRLTDFTGRAARDWAIGFLRQYVTLWSVFRRIQERFPAPTKRYDALESSDSPTACTFVKTPN